MVPELTFGPFIAINLSNRKINSKSHNDALMAKAKTGNWDIPAAAGEDGLKGKTVVLFYSTPQQSSRFYVGTVKAHRIVGETEHKPPRSRYELTAKEGWELVAETLSNFSEFFAGFRMSANPTVVWMDAQIYDPEPERTADAENEEQPPVIGEATSSPRGGYVYVLKSAYGFKVGRTRNIPNRMRSFGVHLPIFYSIPFCVWFDDHINAETNYHRIFAEKHINGEWFDLSDADIDLIRSRNFS